jgi:protein TonB
MPAVASLGTELEKPLGGRWRILLASSLVLVLIAMGVLLWRLRRNDTSNSPAKAVERVTPDLARSNPANKGLDQARMTTDSKAPTVSPKIQADKQPKPKDQGVAAKPSSNEPAKSATKLENGRLRLPAAIPKNAATMNQDEAPPDGGSGVPGSLPGAVPGAVPSSVTNVARDIPVAQSKIPAQKVRVSSGLAQGLLIHQVAPRYPLQARQMRIQGTVVLQAVIGKDGSVQNVRAVSGPQMLIPAATDAVKQWRYKPYLLNGEPVEAETQINVNFSLPD